MARFITKQLRKEANQMAKPDEGIKAQLVALSKKHQEELANDSTLLPNEKEMVNQAVGLVGTIVAPSPRAAKYIAKFITEVGEVISQDREVERELQAEAGRQVSV